MNRDDHRILRTAVCALLALCTASAAALTANAAGTTKDEPPKVYFKEISLGGYHGMAVAENGSLYTWGDNSSGQLGTGDKTDRDEPIKIMSHARQISAGIKTSSAIKENGELFVWGEKGNLGYSAENESNLIPQRLRSNISSVIMGSEGGAFISNQHELFQWKTGIPERISGNVDYVSVRRNHHYCGSGFVNGKGELYVYGSDNFYGSLGTGKQNHYTTIEEPTKILDNVVVVSMGGQHSAAVTTDGNLYTWGRNDYGQLGDGTHQDTYEPHKVEALNQVKSVSVGQYHTAAITVNGDLYVWGADNAYQLGDGYQVDQPLPIKLMENVKQVSIWNDKTLALTEDGRMFIWGTSSLMWNFSQPTPQEIEVFLYKLLGDCDGDDNITSDDALAVLRLSIGLETIDDDDERTFPVSDYDKDDELTSNDAMLILRVSVGY